MISQHPDYLILREYLTKHVPASPETDKAQDASERLVTEVNVLETALVLANGTNERQLNRIENRDVLVSRLDEEIEGFKNQVGSWENLILTLKGENQMLKTSNKLNRDTMVGYQLVAAVGLLFGVVGWFL